MNNYYDPKNVAKLEIGDEFDSVPKESFINEKQDNLFHLSQSYEKKIVDTIYCKHCGGKDFNVGVGDYYTAIRCINCEWEMCIHKG